MTSLSQHNFNEASEKPAEVFSYAPSLDSLTEDQRAKRLKAIQSCGPDTCHLDAIEGYEISVKTARMFGSNYVAAILFTYMATVEKRDNFYPIVVENPALPYSLQHYFMIFDDSNKRVFDFTPDVINGGKAIYRRDIQLAVIRDALSDKTLEQRVGAGLNNLNCSEYPQVVIQVFLDRFNICFQEMKPEEAFRSKF